MRKRSGDTCQVNMYTTMVLHTLTSLGQDVNECHEDCLCWPIRIKNCPWQ